FHSGNHTVKEDNTAFYRINSVKGKFLVFLHVFIICQRYTLHGSEHGHESTVDSSGLSSYQLCYIRIFLLRHDTASCTVAVVDLHELVLVGIPHNDLLAEPA